MYVYVISFRQSREANESKFLICTLSHQWIFNYNSPTMSNLLTKWFFIFLFDFSNGFLTEWGENGHFITVKYANMIFTQQQSGLKIKTILNHTDNCQLTSLIIMYLPNLKYTWKYVNSMSIKSNTVWYFV